MALLAPSIVAADWAKLGEALEVIKSAGATIVHVDVMDGHFVPEISIGLPVVESLRKATDLALDVHLQIERPERFLSDYLKAGADRVSVHYEATRELPRLLETIRARKALAGLAISYPTPVGSVSQLLGHVDFLTILCAEPKVEESQRDFIPRSVEKIRRAVEMRAETRLDFAIQVEGGIGLNNMEQVVRAGADILVAGCDIFNESDSGTRLSEMVRSAARILTSARA